MNNNKLQPAIIGGVVLGLLSAIPFINFSISAAAHGRYSAARLLRICTLKSPTPASIGDGALLGLIAGGIGAIVYVVIGCRSAC
jgi:hypothetical protein